MKKIVSFVVLALLMSGCIPKHVKNLHINKKVNTENNQKVSNITAPKKSLQTQTQTPTKTEKIQKTKILTPEEVEEEKKSKSYKVTMKTKKFAFSDTGFLVEYDKSFNLNVLALGKSVLDLRVKKDEDDVCVGRLCNTKHGFNQTFLVGSYPDDFIVHILEKKPIFGGRNLTKTSTGFIQKIVCSRYGIKYQISNNNVYFKDKKNHILIKLRELKQ